MAVGCLQAPGDRVSVPLGPTTITAPRQTWRVVDYDVEDLQASALPGDLDCHQIERGEAMDIDTVAGCALVDLMAEGGHFVEASVSETPVGQLVDHREADNDASFDFAVGCWDCLLTSPCPAPL